MSKEEEYGVRQQTGNVFTPTLQTAIYRRPFTLAPSSRTTIYGGWVAMDANNGVIQWSTANPSQEGAPGPVTIVNNTNGVLFAGSPASNGPFYAMDAKTGKIIWRYITGATIYGGASATNGLVIVGNGYSVRANLDSNYTRGDFVFAFSINGK